MPAPLKSHLPFLKWHLAIIGSFILCIVDAGISFSVPSPSYFAEWDVKDIPASTMQRIKEPTMAKCHFKKGRWLFKGAGISYCLVFQKSPQHFIGFVYVASHPVRQQVIKLGNQH